MRETGVGPEVSPQPATIEGREFLRFSRLNRTLHILMIVSFMSLALTGMTLKFSYTGWAVILSRLFGGFESAGYIHRVAALLMVGLFVTHIVDLIKKRKRKYASWRSMIFGPDSMLFNKKDLQDFVGNLKWFLGKGPRPK
ncbi:MAG: cytochrome b/b6 domain-containing protein, partial [Ignavibacteriae bacterium]|nr:cytochrome b/b6 domain-containing protein [Ignavibacteriota bacterium]